MRKVNFDDDFEAILICAERYACGRETYMPSLVINYITPIIPQLSTKALSTLSADMQYNEDQDKREKGYIAVEGGPRHGVFGNDTTDKVAWMDFWRRVKAELQKREEKEKAI